MEPQQLRDDTWIFTSALYQTTSTVIRTQQEIFVIDPNWLPEEVESIRSFVKNKQESRNLYLIFTHSDYDHIVGYGAFPGALVIASNAFALNTRKERDVIQVRQFDLSHYITRTYPISYPGVDIPIIHDGDSLQFSETTLTFYEARGHTDEGMFILFEPQGIWIAGDYLSAIEFPLINGSLEEYRLTLSKVDRILENHHIDYLVSGHGPVADTEKEICTRRDEGRQYISDLEAFIQYGKPFPDDVYRARYAFWDGIADWHRENIAHLQK